MIIDRIVAEVLARAGITATRLAAKKGDLFPLGPPDVPPGFFSVKKPVASSQRVTLIDFTSFFIQRGKYLELTSAPSCQ